MGFIAALNTQTNQTYLYLGAINKSQFQFLSFTVSVILPGNLITGYEQERVCGYFAMYRSLGLTRILSEGGQRLYYNPQLLCAPSSAIVRYLNHMITIYSDIELINLCNSYCIMFNHIAIRILPIAIETEKIRCSDTGSWHPCYASMGIV